MDSRSTPETITMHYDVISDKLVRIGDVEFDLDWSAAIANKTSTEKRFVLLKSLKILNTYLEYFKDKPIVNLFEIGIQKGGSTAFFNLLFKPKNHVAIELRAEPVEALVKFSEDATKEGRELVPLFGVDQGNVESLRAIVRENFGSSDEQVLDAVFDDASHLYGPSKASFNTLFPLLRNGGVYVLEDWGWAHWKDFQGEKAHWHDQPALTNLVFEILMTAASRPDIIHSVFMTSVNMLIVRGPATIAPTSFDVTKLYIARGRTLAHI